MSVEDELKKDHTDMQAIVDSKQKIIDAQVRMPENIRTFTKGKKKNALVVIVRGQNTGDLLFLLLLLLPLS